MPDPEIILKVVQKTFPIEIKFDLKISNLIRNFFHPKKDNFTLRFVINLPGNYETTPPWNLDDTWNLD